MSARPAPAPREPTGERPEPGVVRRLAGWILLALTLAYVAAIHHGVAPEGATGEWWQPTGFLLELGTASFLRERPVLGIGVLTLPSLGLALLVVATNRSSWARGLALSAVVTVVLFAFYALVGRRVWNFFAWRGTLVLVCTGLALGFALAAPWLAESWLRQRTRWKLLLYLPVVATALVVMRHVTGTNEAMAFNVSPWPAFTVMGLDLGVYTIAGIQLGVAAGVAAAALWSRAKGPALLLALACPALPIVWFLLRHPDPGRAALVAGAGVATLCALLAALRRTSRPRRAALLALGAGLAAFPVIAGQSLATGDYAASRFVRAQSVIDALAQHYEREDGYPDELDELVANGALDRIPQPRIGFQSLYDLGWLEPIRFNYQNLGSSYILEFESTEWVQCAYNPPWSDEEGDFDGSDLEVEEAWSCPDARPDLW